MEFPQETVDWAKKKAEDIRKSYLKSSWCRAFGAFKTGDLPYGFIKCVEKDQWTPWPHECETVNCQTGAAVCYAVAKALDLEPQMYGVVGLRERGDPPSGYHFFITVKTRGNKRVIVDPRYNLFGHCSFDGNKLRIRDNNVTNHTLMFFDSLIPFSVEEYCEKAESQRTPQGRASVLFDGQSLGHPNIDHWLSKRWWKADLYVKYDVDRNILETRAVYNRLTLQHRVIFLQQKLTTEGIVESRNLTFSYAKKNNWMGFEGLKNLATIPAEEVFALASRARNLKQRESSALDDMVRGRTPELSKISEARARNLETLSQDIKELARKHFSRTLDSASSQELGMVAAEAGYQRARGDRRTVHSHDDLCSICEKWMNEYQAVNEKLSKLGAPLFLTIARMKITPHVRKRLRSLNKKSDSLHKKVDTVSDLHRYDRESRFEFILDRQAYGDDVKQNPPKIEDFTELEIQSAYAGMLAEFIVLASDGEKRLFIRRFKNDKCDFGEKILSAIKAHLRPESVVKLPELPPELETVEYDVRELVGSGS